MAIKRITNRLRSKYNTNNPFEIALAMGMKVSYEELGTINGYYNKQLRMKQIHINCNLSEHMKKITCAHELGHAIMHPNANTPFLRSNTFFSIDKMEIEANTFAIELLVSDELLKEYTEFGIEQISRSLGYHKKLIQLKMGDF